MNANGQSALASLTGKVEKCKIGICDARELDLATPGNITNITQNLKAPGTLGGGQARSYIVTYANGNTAALSSTSDLTAEGTDLSLVADAVNLPKMINRGTWRYYTVKFNPSSVSLSSLGGGFQQINNYGSDGRSLDYYTPDTSLQLDFDLIFDDYSYNDCFSNPLSTLSLSAAVDSVKNIADAVKGKKRSVRPQVEAFMGAMNDTRTNIISFAWGKMLYMGTLTRISSKYTMFSTQGSPVRAVVHMTMECMDSTVSGDSMGQWTKAYKNVFKDDVDNPLVDNVSPTDLVKNLLNINL